MQQINLDFVPSGVRENVYASQYDIGRSVRFNLKDNGATYTLTGAETVTLKIRKPDNTERSESIANTSSTYVIWTSVYESCDLDGLYDCKLKVVNGSVEIGSANFTLHAEVDPYSGRVVILLSMGNPAFFNTNLGGVVVDCTSELPYNSSGYTSATAINSKTAPIHDFAPYHTRINNNIGNLALEKLVGVSCVFNQNLQAQTFTKSFSDYSVVGNGDGTATLTIINPIDSDFANLFNSSYQFITGHKYYAYTGYDNIQLYFKSEDKRTAIFNSTNGSSYNNISLSFNSSLTIGEYTIYLMLIDLTVMFGSTVADYIYTLESGNAGAGVSLFKSLFADEYYPYTANTLMSAKPTGKKIVGFNQWDEEWELGSYSWGTGQPFADNTRIRNKNYIPVFPNINYFNSNSGYAVDYYFYDADKNFISPLYKAAGNQTITTPANCYYMNFCVYASYGTTYNHDICINISDNAKNGTYEPYSETTIVYSGNELRGLLKVGTDGLYADGDIDDGSGSTAVRYVEIDLSDVSDWYEGGTNTADGSTWWYTYDFQNLTDQTGLDFISDNFSNSTAVYIPAMTNHTAFFLNGALYIAVNDNDKTGKMIIPLATPTTAVSTAWSNPIIAKEGGTEEFIDGNEYSIVDLGSLTWVKIGMGGGRNGFRATINEMILTPAANIKINAKCSKYITYTGNEVYLGNIGISGWGANTHDVAVYDPDYESGDATAFKTAMNGVYLIYENTNSVGFQLFSGHDTIYGTDMTVNKAEFGTTVYGGSVDFTTGEVISNKNADGTDKTAETIAISPVMVGVFEGDNYIISDANGSNSVKYFKKG